ncbi:MAG: flagellar basal body P-ring protein FlgI [Candidatus Scalindua sp.]|nr:flagellar basal body P-ring protein FlgI [Candidatus Scalindua sp.]
MFHGFSMHRYCFCIIVLIVTLAFTTAPVVHGEIITRVKDISSIQGMRDNYLFGYGLIVGLQGTGDSTSFGFTSRLAKNVFEKLGVVTTDEDFDSKNIAAVLVTAQVHSFAKPGDRIDLLLSSVGDAKSLEGGVLVHTVLQGIDNEVYAVAQGPLSIGGGFNVGGKAADTRKNIATTANIPNGAFIEKEIPVHLFFGNAIRVNLHESDFTTARRLMNVVNSKYPGAAQAISAANVEITPPKEFRTMNMITQFISQIEELPVTPDAIARVIINERTGTIVAGENVRISTVAIAHGSLTITINERQEVSQPGPFAPASATTEVLDRTSIDIGEEEGKLNVIPEGATISEIARGLNVLGVTPRDLIAIFQAIQKAGALHAELILM